MNSAQIVNQIYTTNLPIRIFGKGEEVTHIFVGKLIGADGKETESVCLIAQPKIPISDDFKRQLNSVGCQCGKQKTAGLPLCGICFSNLKPGIKTALRQNRDGELEQTYHLAVKSLREGKNYGRRKRLS